MNKVPHYSYWPMSNPFVTVICYFAELLQCRAVFEAYDLISPVDVIGLTNAKVFITRRMEAT